MQVEYVQKILRSKLLNYLKFEAGNSSSKPPSFFCNIFPTFPLGVCKFDKDIYVIIWVFPKIMGTPKSSILIGISIINHPFWGTPI